MTHYLAGIAAALILLATDPMSAATVDSNRRAIAELERRTVERTEFVTARIQPGVPHASPPAMPERSGPSALRLSAEEEDWYDRYMRERPWLLINRPQRGARRVKSGWIIHRSKVKGEGFFTPLTEQEANQR